MQEPLRTSHDKKTSKNAENGGEEESKIGWLVGWFKTKLFL